MKQRDQFIDVLRGSAMILVVWAHCGMPFSDIVNYFHMPLFFIISGYLFRDADIKRYFSRKVKGLYIPFLIYEFIFLIFRNLFIRLNLYSTADWSWMFPIKSVKSFLMLILHILAFDNIDEMLAPFWFVTCLFLADMFFYFMSKLIHNEYIKLVICSFALVIAYVCRRSGIILEWTYNFKYGLSAILIALWAIGVGHFLRSIYALEWAKNHIRKIPILEIVSMILILLCYISGLKGEMLTVSYNNYVMFLICAVVGSLSWSMMSYRLYLFMDRHFNIGIKVLSNIGRMSFHYMAIQFLVMKMVSGFLLLITGIDGNIGDSGIASAIHGIYRAIGFLLTMLCLYLLIYLGKALHEYKKK